MTARPSMLRRVPVVTLGVLMLVIGVSSAALAQVPELPPVPEIPEPVGDALRTVQDTAVPLLTDVALAGQPAANAIGFALRPGCSVAGTAVVLTALLSGTVPLPVSPGLALLPVFVACGAAFDEGPADPVFEQVDTAAGPPVQDATQPVIDQAATAMSPVRPTLSEGCSVLSLFGSAPKQVPPPLHRLDLLGAVCG